MELLSIKRERYAFEMSEPRSLVFIPSSVNSCVNRRTLDGNDDITEVSPLVAFGSPESFVCYTLDDLKTSLKALDGIHDYRLLKYDREAGHAVSIEKEVVTLTLRQVEELREVIEELKDVELATLFAQIDTESEGLREKIREINRLYFQLPEADKDNYKRAFRAMFRAGMYARRWKGDNHPYPKLEEETTRLDYDVNAETLTELGNISSFSDLLSIEGSELFSKLPVITHHKTPRPTDLTIAGLLSRIGRGEESGSCIRMESLLLIGTGSSYLRYLCKETIEGYDAQGYVQIAVSPEEQNSSVFGVAAAMPGMHRGAFPRHLSERAVRYQRMALVFLVLSIVLMVIFPKSKLFLPAFLLLAAQLVIPSLWTACLVLLAGSISVFGNPFIGGCLWIRGSEMLRLAGISQSVRIGVIIGMLVALVIYCRK